MPIVKVITDPQEVVAQLMTWLDTPVEEEGYDGFDIDPYDNERERGQ